MTKNSSKNTLKIKLKSKEYLSDHSGKIISFIDKKKKVLLDANPATGKTRLFADLAIELKNSNGKARIIFLTPFLIIQDQINSYLTNKGHKIDFILNGESKKKSPDPSDIIIASTYHSFHHISDNLTKNDYVIVDEAHSLVYNFKEDKQKRFFFHNTIINIYNTEAKLVLMTGTPIKGLNKILNLHTIKVKEEKPIQSKINICFSNSKPFDIAISFAENIITDNHYDSNSLNVIYIKDKKMCEKISYNLNKHMGLNTKILTSQNKEEEHYREIIDEMNVPKSIQFLVTTNVISTGANIHNTNIGKALMINEYNPIEIKQFSKRFRNKLGIEVDVVNSFNPNSFHEPELATKSDIKTERKKQRKYFKAVLKNIQKFKDSENTFSGFKYSFEPNYKGTPQHLIDIIIERFVKQESYFNDLLINNNFESKDISKALKKYDDIKVIIDDSLYEYKETNKDSLEQEIDSELKNNRDTIINQIIKNEDLFLNAISKEMSKYDKTTQYQFNYKIKPNFIGNSTNPTIIETIQKNGFKSSFVIPMLKDIYNLETPSKSLFFNEYIPKNKQNHHKVSIITSKIIEKYFDLSNTSSNFNLFYTKEIYNIKELDIELQFMITIIKAIYRNLVNKDFFHASDLTDHLNSSSKLKAFRNYKDDFEKLPLISSFKKNNLNHLTTPQVIAIAKGIFLTKNTMTNRVDSNGDSKKAYLFCSKLPNKYQLPQNSRQLDKDYQKISDNSVIINTVKHKQYKNKFNLDSRNKIIPNQTILNYLILGRNYYINTL